MGKCVPFLLSRPGGLLPPLITCSAMARDNALHSLERDSCEARVRWDAGSGVHNPYEDNLSHQTMISQPFTSHFAYRDLITLFWLRP
jgi:hypothetical protein